MSVNNRNRRKFGLLVSVTFSLAMNLIFLTSYNQPFDLLNWLMQLPLTIPAGAFVGIGVGFFISKYAPDLSKHKKGAVFSFLMSVVMSLIMVPFALIPRMGFDMVILLKAVAVGIPVGMVAAYLVVPFCHWLVFRKFDMPDFSAPQRS
ncbi:hypothetical protein [Photobacterium kagoshimensis]|uniref:hypothetical protein n=1 Tax=Photobacterium kagoshimensis TaxID=2910242 RepID=UPI003D10B726